MRPDKGCLTFEVRRITVMDPMAIEAIAAFVVFAVVLGVLLIAASRAAREPGQQP